MGQFIIRNLEEAVYNKIFQMAQNHGRNVDYLLGVNDEARQAVKWVGQGLELTALPVLK